MGVCYSGFIYSTPRTFNLSIYYFTPWKSVSLYTKILEGLEEKTRGVEPLSPIAGDATASTLNPPLPLSP